MTENTRPTAIAEGVIRDYVKDIDGVPHVVLEQMTNGEWVQVAAVPASTQFDQE